jgi:hypothetical protein
MEISKYVKKVDVVEEKGRVFVHLHKNRANNPSFIKKVLSKYNLGEIVYKNEDLYVYEIPVRNYKISIPSSPSVQATETTTAEAEETPIESPPKRTRRTRRSSRKSTKTTNDS